VTSASLMDKIKKAIVGFACTLLVAASPVVALAQDAASRLPSSTLGSQSLRPYWHVFIAYTIVIVMVLGWVISIGRRLRDVEERLGK
jgi:CcmD family protein